MSLPTAPEVTATFDLRPYADWLSERDENPWVVDGLIHKSSTLLTAKPKQGKSLLVVDLACALSRGEEEWLGRKICDGPYRVAFGVSDPGAESETAKRLRNLNAPRIEITRLGRNLSQNQWAELACLLKMRGVRFFIADSGTNLVSDVVALSEVARLHDGLKNMVDNGISVLLVHHEPKNGKRGQASGIYAWESWPRWIMSMRRQDGYAVVECRGNEAPEWPMNMSLMYPRPSHPGSRFRVTQERPRENRTVREVDGDSELFERIAAKSGWTSQQHIAGEMGVSQSKISRVLRRNNAKINRADGSIQSFPP